MPIHDWTKVSAGTFHHFHQLWTGEISNALNAGLLPKGYYAMADQVAGDPHPDVLTLEAFDEPGSPEEDDGGGTAVAIAHKSAVTAVTTSPPRVRYTLDAEELIYSAKATRLGIFHSSGDRVVAFLEIVSLGNKHSPATVQQFVDKLGTAIAHGIHLLVIDLHPPGRHNPLGLHEMFWGSPPTVTTDEPLSLAAYRAHGVPTAYFEPTKVGAVLIDMPLFLTRQHYVNVPLEATYLAAWRGVPDRWKRVIEG